jgi:hypothetical protein
VSVPAIPNEGFGGVVGVELVPSGLRFTPGLEFDDWTVIGGQLRHHGEWSTFACGDWLNHGDEFFPEKFAQGAEALGRAPDTLMEWMRVARRFPHERRRPGLTWSHHHYLASVRDDAEQNRWLDIAERDGLSVPKLKAQLRSLRDPTAPRRDGS